MQKDFYYIARIARGFAGANDSDFKDEKVRDYMNRMRGDMYDDIITNVHEKIFWDEAYVSLMTGVSEYNIPGPDDDKPEAEQVFDGFSKILRVYIKKNTTYSPLEYTKINDATNDFSSMSEGYSVADESILIFPTPTADIAEGLKVQGINNLRDIAVGASEFKIFADKVPTRYFETLALGVAVQYVRYDKRDQNEAMLLEGEYEKQKKKMISAMNTRSPRILENDPLPCHTELQ